MNLPRYQPGPVDYWCGAALTEFINGAISGLLGAGSVSGIGTGIASTTHLGAALDWLGHVLVVAGAMALAAIGNGLKRVVVWHSNNPFPNPWPKPPNQ